MRVIRDKSEKDITYLDFNPNCIKEKIVPLYCCWKVITDQLSVTCIPLFYFLLFVVALYRFVSIEMLSVVLFNGGSSTLYTAFM